MYFVRYKCGSGRVGNFVLHDGSGRVQKKVTRGQLWFVCVCVLLPLWRN